ncbi:ATP-grasp domain-containing protein [Marinactinospora rubrisoli]|uniref:ATP-grasp domain-containing protein n=1 Tax=Marinactinospora rubrisoli TaxID=2715399 RepID=A0ABW2KGY9_9ACTN
MTLPATSGHAARTAEDGPDHRGRPEPPAPFTRRLRTALTGGADTPLVHLGNFEVEEQWAVGEHGLPRLRFAAGRAIVYRLDQFALLLAGGADHVVLKTAPDPDHLGHLSGLGLDLPTVLAPARQRPERTVTLDVLDDPALLAELGRLAAAGHRLLPHGFSRPEERLAERTSLRPLPPAAAVCKAVNSKIYSRRAAETAGLRQPAGRACETLAELADAVAWARTVLASGGRVVVKDAFGVSGSGLAVVAEERRLDRLHRMVADRAAAAGSERVAVVVEEWVAKSTDLNYHFTVARDGTVRFDFVREALTRDGVHLGHRTPARLTAAQHTGLAEAAQRLGALLHADGYHGVVGVDALVQPDGSLHQVIEINARNNMSTYHAPLHDLIVGPDRTTLTRHYPLRLRTPLRFAELRDALGGLLLTPGAPAGLLVTNHATVNAAAPPEGGPPGSSFDGRLYGLVVADTAERLAAIDTEIAARLHALTSGDRRDT